MENLIIRSNHQLQNNNCQIIENFNQDLFKDFLDYCDNKPTTRKAYTQNLKVFANWLNNNGILSPTRKDIIAFRDELINGIKDANGEWIQEPKQATTVQAYINSIKQFFNWTSYNNIYKNISEGVKTPVINKYHKKDHLSIEETKALIDSCNGDTEEQLRNKVIIYLCFICGLRDIEISRAQIKDISRSNSENVLFVQGKGRDDKSEYVKLPLGVLKTINDYLTIRGENTNDKEHNEKPLIVGVGNRQDNKPVRADSISRIVKTQLRKIGIDSVRITSHSGRHTLAYTLLSNGVAIQEVSQLLRHKNISTTMIYVDELNRAENNGESIFAEMVGVEI